MHSLDAQSSEHAWWIVRTLYNYSLVSMMHSLVNMHDESCTHYIIIV